MVLKKKSNERFFAFFVDGVRDGLLAIIRLLQEINLFQTIQADTQNTEFVNYMLQLQFMTQSYYDSKMTTFHDARRSIQQHLIDFNTAGVAEIAEGKNGGLTIKYLNHLNLQFCTNFCFINRTSSNYIYQRCSRRPDSDVNRK